MLQIFKKFRVSKVLFKMSLGFINLSCSPFFIFSRYSRKVRLAHFLSQYHITHTFGIPYISQGQAIIERANCTLHDYLEKIKKGEQERFMKPKDILNKTLLALNFLNKGISHC